MIFTMTSRCTSRIRKLARRAAYPVFVCGSLALCLACFCAAKDRPAPVNLFPRLQAGQTLAYPISYHNDKHIKTESSLIVAPPPDFANHDVNAVRRLQILIVTEKREPATL